MTIVTVFSQSQALFFAIPFHMPQLVLDPNDRSCQRFCCFYLIFACFETMEHLDLMFTLAEHQFLSVDAVVGS